MAADAPSNSFRFSVGCLLVAVTLVAVTFGGCHAFILYADGEDNVATIDCGGGREIVISVARSWEVSQPIYYSIRENGFVISVARSWEVSQPIYYSIRENGAIVVPTTYFDNNNPPAVPQFTHITANDGDLVGVAYTDDPTNYIFIHDFSDGKTHEAADRPDLQALLDGSHTGTSAGG